MNQTVHFHDAMKLIHDGEDAVSPEALARVDLNLIVAFDALARERSVTRAAGRLGVTQSAVSHALRRLRDLFDDPLLVRGRSGMALTPRAEALVVPLRSGLVMFGRALAEPSVFDPATTHRAFRLATPDLFDVLAIPPLLARIRREAPGVDISVVPVADARLSERLETGEVDVAVVPQLEAHGNVAPEPSAPGLVRRTLFRDRFTCLIRTDHPAVGGKRARRGSGGPALTLEDYAALSHVLVSPRGEGPGVVDQVLEERGIQRRIALRVPNFYSALAIVAKSDLILTAPSEITSLVPSDAPIVALPPPLRLPRHRINLLWHERFSKDPGHGWLRGLVTEIGDGIKRGLPAILDA
jgi:DNA-binding transcriptional LysR family regulator